MKRLHLYCLLWLAALARIVRAEEMIDGGMLQIADFAAEDQSYKSHHDFPLPCSHANMLDKLLLFNPVDILSHNIYKHSNNVLNRSIHDLPTFTWTCVDQGCFSFSALPFYNQTSKMYFTRDSGAIKSYINLDDKNLLHEITKTTKEFDFDIPIGDILPLFDQMRLQERRAGFYFRAASNYGPCTFQFSLPFLYLERNFFFPEAEQRRIEESEFLRQFSLGTNKHEAEAFLAPHLAADKIGFGDFRFHGLYTPYKKDDNRFTLGGFITLPTAFSIQEGLVLGSFCKKGGIPKLNLFDLLLVAFGCKKRTNHPLPLPPNLKATRAQEINSLNSIKNYLLGVIDRLTANVAETPLGNNGHVSFGPLFEGVYTFHPNWSITTQAKVEYLVPNYEIRGFIQRNDPKSFDRDFTDKALAEKNIDFFEDKLNSFLFLKQLKVKVKPGAIAQVNSHLNYTVGCLKGSFGYDFYYQAKEHFSHIEKPHPPLEINKAFNPAGLQHKIFGSFVGVVPQGENVLLEFGVRGDYTFIGRGLGRDWTLAIDIAYLY